MSNLERREELAEVRASLRQMWPSPTADDVAALPRERDRAARVIREKTGAPLEEIETTLSGLYGFVPEQQDVGDT